MPSCFLERRFWRYALLPYLETVFIILVQWRATHAFPLNFLEIFVALILPPALLIRLLDRRDAPPFALRRSGPLGLLSVAFLLGFTALTGHHIGDARLAAAVLGVILAFAATVPAREFFRRAARAPAPSLLALAGALCPVAYHVLGLWLWKATWPLTVTPALQILGWLDIPVRIGAIVDSPKDYLVTLESPDWRGNVVFSCSLLNFPFLFLALLIVFVLLDWRRARRPGVLLAVFATATALTVLLNAARIAATHAYFVYGVSHWGHTLATYRAGQAFHHTLAFHVRIGTLALFLGGLYALSAWWPRVRESKPNSDRNP